MSTHATGRMTSWGVGPKFAVISIVMGLLAIFVNHYFFASLLLPYNLFRFSFGVGLIILGLVMMLVAASQVHQAFNDGKLITSGIYSYVRDPVYAAWILLIVPGLFLATGIPFLIVMPFAMYALIRTLIIDEERYLEQKFGKEYLDYKKTVNSIVPKMHRKKQNK
ncbi:MAG TPA: isoprenylcysteine carboxylmethyltransferase family protein [Candidatus Bathyarchaeia archaeon]|nr:isoprenylcysteine carboxylmethyltransferase family protein [Candidatus Bathyarchaeia archaeon]